MCTSTTLALQRTEQEEKNRKPSLAWISLSKATTKLDRCPSPHPPNLMKGSKRLFLTRHEKLQTDVCLSTHSECHALSHADEKPWKSRRCPVSVLRQCLSLAGRRKQSHRFLILIPLYRFSPIDHLSILNEMEGERNGGLMKDKTFPFPPPSCRLSFQSASLSLTGFSLTSLSAGMENECSPGAFVEVHQTWRLTESWRFD